MEKAGERACVGLSMKHVSTVGMALSRVEAPTVGRHPFSASPKRRPCVVAVPHRKKHTRYSVSNVYRVKKANGTRNRHALPPLSRKSPGKQNSTTAPPKLRPRDSCCVTAVLETVTSAWRARISRQPTLPSHIPRFVRSGALRPRTEPGCCPKSKFWWNNALHRG